MKPSDDLDALRHFRRALHKCFHRRADALFELTDAILTAGVVPSPVHLSLQPSHHRGWGSLYAALSQGTMDAEALGKLVASHPLEEDRAAVYAVDVSVWPRCDAECSPERGFYYHPSRHSAGQPIVAGWAYQFIAQLSFERDSWVAPMDLGRLHPSENQNEVAAGRVRSLCERLDQRKEKKSAPLFVFDAGYDPVQLQQGLEGHGAQLLVRLRSGRRFYADPEGPPAPTGRPRRHGKKFDCKNPKSWPEPTHEHISESEHYGHVRVRAWARLHPKVRLHKDRGSRGPLPIVRGTLVLVEVGRLPRGERRREPKGLWLWWHGPGGATPDLDLLWRAYVRRFDLEHTFRFFKQTLGWTTPRVRHPEQADRWSWLIVAAYVQLRLARACVSDRRLPWERRYAPGKLTPCGVRRAVLALLLALGTPAEPPKPCGRSPGRPKGRLSGRAKRYPALKKSA